MKVKELISDLNKFDPEDRVTFGYTPSEAPPGKPLHVVQTDFFMGGALISLAAEERHPMYRQEYMNQIPERDENPNS